MLFFHCPFLFLLNDFASVLTICFDLWKCFKTDWWQWWWFAKSHFERSIQNEQIFHHLNTWNVTYVTEWHKKNSRICRKKRSKPIFFCWHLFLFEMKLLGFHFQFSLTLYSDHMPEAKSRTQKEICEQTRRQLKLLHCFFFLSLKKSQLCDVINSKLWKPQNNFEIKSQIKW